MIREIRSEPVLYISALIELEWSRFASSDVSLLGIATLDPPQHRQLVYGYSCYPGCLIFVIRL